MGNPKITRQSGDQTSFSPIQYPLLEIFPAPDPYQTMAAKKKVTKKNSTRKTIKKATKRATKPSGKEATKKTTKRTPKKATKRGKAKKVADLIISKSRTKGAVESCNVSGDFYAALDGYVREAIKSAEERAWANGRKTLRPQDL